MWTEHKPNMGWGQGVDNLLQQSDLLTKFVQVAFNKGFPFTLRLSLCNIHSVEHIIYTDCGFFISIRPSER
jgi:hypothetical protein